jgi:hypothetical protein
MDGKVCGAVTNISSQNIMNNVGIMSRKIEYTANFAFGLFLLHACIRFFQCLLHTAYGLEIKRWHVRSAEDKAKVAARKPEIAEKLRSEMELIVNHTITGSGTINDGKTTRRFFKNPSLSSATTGVDEKLGTIKGNKIKPSL